jgi:hypothetical protein
MLENNTAQCAQELVQKPQLLLTESKAVWKIEDSNVGSGVITAKAKVTDCWPLVELTLIWNGDCEQPADWRINWVHHPDYLLRELPEYLLRFCPVGNEMVEVLQSLSLDQFEMEADSDFVTEEVTADVAA